MSIAQTYFLAHKARAKLSSEAARPNHNLRLLVGHANLLDSLMLELADAERQQESWFNESVRGASSYNSSDDSTSSEERHVQWADTIIEEPEHDWCAEDAESDSDSASDDSEISYDENDYDEEDIEMADAVPLCRVPSHSSTHHLAYPTSTSDDYDMSSDSDEYDEYDEDEEEEDIAGLALRRSPSRSVLPSSSTPPELLDDSSDDSTEDEAMPPSPPTTVIATFEDAAEKHDTTTEDAEEPDAVPDEEKAAPPIYYIPTRARPGGLVSAISVY